MPADAPARRWLRRHRRAPTGGGDAAPSPTRPATRPGRSSPRAARPALPLGLAGLAREPPLRAGDGCGAAATRSSSRSCGSAARGVGRRRRSRCRSVCWRRCGGSRLAAEVYTLNLVLRRGRCRLPASPALAPAPARAGSGAPASVAVEAVVSASLARRRSPSSRSGSATIPTIARRSCPGNPARGRCSAPPARVPVLRAPPVWSACACALLVAGVGAVRLAWWLRTFDPAARSTWGVDAGNAARLMRGGGAQPPFAPALPARASCLDERLPAALLPLRGASSDRSLPFAVVGADRRAAPRSSVPLLADRRHRSRRW